MARTVRATLKSAKFLDQSTKTKGRRKVVFSMKEDSNNWSPLNDFRVTSHENHYGEMGFLFLFLFLNGYECRAKSTAFKTSY